MQQYLNFKVIVLGPQGVGKSSIITRYINGQFCDQYHVTVGVQYTSRIVEIDQQTHVRLQIWDTAGQELFKAVVRTFYKGISAVFLVYAINSLQSFRDLRNWVNEVREYSHQQTVVFLIGSKNDLERQREVSTEEAAAYLKEIGGVLLLQISSKTGHQIQSLFSKAAELLHKKFTANQPFRNLVRPMQASVISGKLMSMQIFQGSKKEKARTKKKCC